MRSFLTRRLRRLLSRRLRPLRVERLEDRRLLAVGDLDTTFDTDGRQTVLFDSGGSLSDVAQAVAIAADGKIVLAGSRQFGTTDFDFAVVRLNTNGSLDTTFNSSGKRAVPFDLGGGNSDGATDLVIQPDGNIVVAGFAEVTAGSFDFAVARLTPSGALDTTFSGDGKVTIPFDLGNTNSDVAWGVALQPDGKIVVVGYCSRSSAGDFDIAVARLNPNGSLDTTFGGTGKAIVFFDLGPSGQRFDAGYDVQIQSDGKIVIVGHAQVSATDADFAVARLTPDGSLDSTFDTDGKRSIAFSTDVDIAQAVAIQPDGKIVIGGTRTLSATDSDFAFARLNPDGSFDSTFNGSGTRSLAIDIGSSGNRLDQLFDLKLQADGKIVAAGSAQFSGNDHDMAVARLNTDGSTDNTFSTDGKRTISFDLGGTNFDAANGMAIAANGAIVLAGLAARTTGDDFAIARLEGDTPQRDTVAQAGFVFGAGNTGADLARNVVTDLAGNAYVVGSFQGTVDFDPGAGTANRTSAGGSDVFIARYTPSGALSWVVSLGAAGDEIAAGVAITLDGRLWIAGSFLNTVDFDPGAGTTNLASSGGRDAFALALNASNGTFVSAFRHGSSADDVANDVAIDGSGNIYVAGAFQGTVDFDPGAGTANRTSAGDFDAFLASYTSGGVFRWADAFGGTGADVASAVALSGTFVTTVGFFNGTADFDPGAGTTNLISAGVTDAFAVTVFPGSGGLVQAYRVGGTGNDSASDITVDSFSRSYVVANFEGTVDADPGAGTTNVTSAGGSDVLVSAFTSGGALLWAKSFGGTGTDLGYSITAGNRGRVFVTGAFTGSADFDPSAATFNLLSSGAEDAFVVGLTSAAGGFVSAWQSGGTGSDFGFGVATDGADILQAGSFQSTATFNLGTNNASRTAVGSSDAFLARLNNVNIGLGPFVINGTAGADTIVFNVVNASTIQVIVNGASRFVYTSLGSQFLIDGLGGSDLVFVNNDFTASEGAVFLPGAVNMIGQRYAVSLVNGETFVAYGNAGDTQIFPGSAGDDVFYAFPAASIMTSGTLVTTTVGYTATTALGSAGADGAVLIDSSGADTFIGRTNQSTMTGPGYANTINGYDQVYVFGGNGADQAQMFDGASDDVAYGLNAYSILSGTGFFYEVITFPTVRMFASAGSDRVTFYDSAGADTFAGRFDKSTLTGPGYSVEANAFDIVYALAFGGGTNTSDLQDSAGHDQLFVDGNVATFFSGGVIFQLYNFNSLTAHHTTGSDTIKRTAVSMGIVLDGTWIET